MAEGVEGSTALGWVMSMSIGCDNVSGGNTRSPSPLELLLIVVVRVGAPLEYGGGILSVDNELTDEEVGRMCVGEMIEDLVGARVFRSQMSR